MKRRTAVVALVLLCIASDAALVWSALIYSSLSQLVPWYEPCGMQLLGILFISIPVMAVVSTLQAVISRSIQVPIRLVLTFLLPAIVVAAPLLVGAIVQCDTRFLSFGAILCMVSAVAEPVLTVISLRKETHVANKDLHLTE